MSLRYLETIDSLAIVGATGIVGRECLSILSDQKIKINKIKLLASERSVGEVLELGSDRISVEVLNEDSFDDVDAAFFSTPKEITFKYVPIAAQKGCVVIDDSNCFRMNPDVPLVVPQINGGVLRNFTGYIMSTPNCSTTPLALALKPLLDEFGLKRVVVSTYQSVSGAGKKAVEELSQQCASLLSGQTVKPEVFPHEIAFNVLPGIGSFLESGYSDEEQKVTNELRKILEVPDLKVTATAVRVPTFCGHGMSANIELEDSFDSVEQVRELLDKFSGLKVMDKPETHIYPTNRECTGSDLTFVGRVRRDPTVTSGLNLWVIADNLRRGAALNAMECLNTLYGYRRMN